MLVNINYSASVLGTRHEPAPPSRGTASAPVYLADIPDDLIVNYRSHGAVPQNSCAAVSVYLVCCASRMRCDRIEYEVSSKPAP